MEKKKFITFYPCKGFTLIEVLASIVILSAAAAGIFLFFTNAMKYTSYNQGKTVAINVARGVLSYVERLDFSTLQKYVEDEINSTNALYVELDAAKCGLSLFENKQVCEALFRPTINNVTYDEQRIHVFIIPYNDPQRWNDLKQSPPAEFPASLQQKIKETAIENTDPKLQKYLLKVYVIVRWGDDPNQAEWLEGVIANETIR
ncbi:prepilin-type N-terminal cleavage/methylation domain-containing protein [Anoxybacteroides tepidamans]|uniref:type IV pilus modification PilV family protein n=1 Tax=Anoxybacteroides tepidamans TaxID=265948 RepID=UPI0004838580|nr:type II secretion system protein [Anoxybacillus tepidamans]